MAMGRDIYLMFMLFISIILVISVHWFLGVINFIIAYGYLMEA
jgi:predicted membrane chloride channel (bestrophin family)